MEELRNEIMIITYPVYVVQFSLPRTFSAADDTNCGSCWACCWFFLLPVKADSSA